MANRFLNNIKINDSYTLPPADGTADQIIKTNGTGQLSFVDQGDIVVGEADKAKSVTLRVKNSTASPMSKGQVVCEAVSATPPNGNLIEVALADNNGTNTMPALGILNEDLDAAGGANDEGDAIMFGKVSGIDTSAFSVGDEVFVDDTPGGLTATKPTGVKYIQKVGVVIRDDDTNGTIEVFGAGRVNDVPTPLYIDHANQRLGIGEPSPSAPLHLQATTNNAFKINNSSSSSVSIVSDNTYLGLYPNSYIILGRTTLAYADLMFLEGKKIRWNETDGTWYDVLYSSGTDNLIKFGSVTSVSTGGDTAFYHNSSEKMRLTSTGLGIGTTSPNYKLDVNGLARFTDTLRVDTTSDTALQLNSTDDGPVYMSYARNGDRHAYVGFGGSSDQFTIMNEETAGRINLGTAGSTRVTILESGNVGIGTTTPTAKLEIDGNSGNIKIGDASNYNGISLNGTLDIGNYNFLSRSSDKSLYINRPLGSKIHFREGNSDQVLIDSGGNVGIGTTSPSQKLHVVGNARVTGAYYDSTNSPGTSGQILSSTATGTDWIDGSAIPGVPDGSGTANYTARWIDTDTLGTGVLYDNGTNVGIGTTAPGNKLDIVSGYNNGVRISGQGAVNNWMDIKILNYVTEAQAASFTDSNHIYTTNPTSGTAFPFTEYGALVIEGRDNTNGGIALRTGGGAGRVTRIAIKEGGNVGIGTTSPGAKLDVNGVIVSKGGSYTSGIETGTDIGLVIQKGDYIKSDDGNYLRNIIGHTASGIIEIGQGFTSLISDIRLKPGGSGNIIFEGSGSEDMRINSSGNVGIGTTNPGVKLDVSSTGTAMARIISSDGNTARFDLLSSGNSRYSLSALASDSLLVFDEANGHTAARYYGGSSGSWIFRTNNIDRLKIDSLGNVGIGTASPSQKLQVEGNSWIKGIYYDTSGDAGTSGQVLSSTATGTNWITLNDIYYTESEADARFVNVTGDTMTGTLFINRSGSGQIVLNNRAYFGTHYTSTDVWIYGGTGDTILLGGGIGAIQNDVNVGNGDFTVPNGNVGIGTTSPRTKLHVSGLTGDDDPSLGASTAPLFVSNTANSYGLNIGVNNVGAAWLQAQSNTSSIAYNLLLNPLGGNVGIGTTSPSKLLEIKGGNNEAVLRLFNDQANTWDIQNSTDGKLDFIRGGSNTYMRIDQFGHVGIGVTSHSFLLDIGDSRNDRDVFRVNGSNADVLFSGNVDAPTGGVGLWNFINTGTNATTRFYVQDANNSNDRLTFRFTGNGGSNEILSGTSSGNVGIGTTSPSEKLEVVGNIISTFTTVGTPALITSEYSSSNVAELESNMSGGKVVGTSEGGGFVISSYSDSHINSGNVGIGTTSPSQKLEVSGTVKSSGLDVDGQGNSATNFLQYTRTDSTQPASISYDGTGGFDFNLNGGVVKFSDANSGSVGIGTTSPGYKLDVSGTIRATGDVIAFSDIRVKENIKTIDNALNKVKALRGVEYNKIDNPEKSIGVIAQEIEEVIPEVVREDNQGMKSVAYGNITAVLIEAIKEQQNQIDELKSIINASTK